VMKTLGLTIRSGVVVFPGRVSDLICVSWPGSASCGAGGTVKPWPAGSPSPPSQLVAYILKLNLRPLFSSRLRGHCLMRRNRADDGAVIIDEPPDQGGEMLGRLRVRPNVPRPEEGKEGVLTHIATGKALVTDPNPRTLA